MGSLRSDDGVRIGPQRGDGRTAESQVVVVRPQLISRPTVSLASLWRFRGTGRARSPRGWCPRGSAVGACPSRLAIARRLSTD